MRFDKFVNTILEQKTPQYSALVLNKDSKEALLSDPQITKYLNKNHDIIAHHMTIKMGGIKGTLHEQRIGAIEKIHATHVGQTEDGNVVAVKVDGISDNKTPHITIGVNRDAGAKPVQSNNITKWDILRTPIALLGQVEELY